MNNKAEIDNRKRLSLVQQATQPRRGRGTVAVTSAWTQLTDYLAWQQGQECTEKRIRMEHAETVIQNGDPECDAVIAALEEGWTRPR